MGDEFKPCKLVLTDAGITQYVYEDCAHIAKPVVEGEYYTADWMISLDGRLVGVQLYHAALDAQSAERTRAEVVSFKERCLRTIAAQGDRFRADDFTIDLVETAIRALPIEGTGQ